MYQKNFLENLILIMQLFFLGKCQMGINFEVHELPEKYQQQIAKKLKTNNKLSNISAEENRTGNSKYNNEKSVIGQQKFDSKKEANRWLVLKDMEKHGEITKLERQVPFTLIPNQRGNFRNERAVKYVADFVFWKDGKMVVEDVKSEITRKLPAYILKRKMMKYILNIEVVEA